MVKLEKVIDALGRCTCHVPDACRDCAYLDKPAPDCWLALERDALELLKEREWVSVKDRLPEEKDWVLCYCRAKIKEVLRFQNGEWYHDPNRSYMSWFVTHWMPLPEPPKEGDSE